MPIYEYECPKCGRFDAMQGINDKPLKANPDCKEKNCPKKAVKVMSSTSFQLVGGGWYKTDYGSSGKAGTKPESKSDKTEKSDKSTSAESTSDKKNGGKKGGGGCGSGCSCH